MGDVSWRISGLSLVNDLLFFPSGIDQMRWGRGLFCMSKFIVDGQLFLFMFATLETGDWQCIVRGKPGLFWMFSSKSLTSTYVPSTCKALNIILTVIIQSHDLCNFYKGENN